MGLPGTGKTTLAKELAQKIGAVHLNTDRIRTELGMRGKYSAKHKARIYEEMKRQMVNYLEAGETVIVDGTFSRADLRREFLQEAQILGMPWHVFFLEASEDLIKKRVSEKRTFSEADFTVYKRVKESYDLITIPHSKLFSGAESSIQLVKTALTILSDEEQYDLLSLEA